MYRFKLSAILLSLLARLGLSEPNYSILDESSNRWLPDDTLLTGLNTIYNSIYQSLQDDDKKKRPMSVIAAAIVEYLSSDLTDEQDKLNTALNVITRIVTPESQDELDSLRNMVINGNEVTKRSDVLQLEDNSVQKGQDYVDLYNVKDFIILNILLDANDKKNDINEQYYKYDHKSLTDDIDTQIVKTIIN